MPECHVKFSERQLCRIVEAAESEPPAYFAKFRDFLEEEAEIIDKRTEEFIQGAKGRPFTRPNS